MTHTDANFLLLSSRVTEETSYQERRSSLSYDYVTYFEKLSYTVVPVPCNTNQVEGYFHLEPKAVVLTGGNTVGNSSLGDIVDDVQGVYIERDNVELELIGIAIAKQIPVLGICRGMQIINRFFGGRVQHGIEDHVGREHRLVADSCGLLNGKTTNSFHGDGIAVEHVAKGLRIIAVSEDGFVEAIAHDDHSILGLQWHPERQHRPFDDLIVNQLLNEQVCP